jgi:hypothetical protein
LYKTAVNAIRAFWDGQGRVMASVYPGRYLAFEASDKEILSDGQDYVRRLTALPGSNVPTMFPDFGTISTAKHWGGKVVYTPDSHNVHIEPAARTAREALAIEPRPADDPELDMAHSIRLYKALSEKLGIENLGMRSPDMQGVLNTAGLIMDQEEMLIEMYTEPETLHAFLSKVCDFLIKTTQYLRLETGNRVCGNIWPYTFLPCESGVALTQDMMPLLPPDLYKEFGIPYLERISDALGGVQIHCCGDWGRHAANLSGSAANIRAVECHYPFTRVEELEPLWEKAVLIPYIMLDQQDDFASTGEYYEHLIANTPDHVRYWFAWPEDSEEAIAFVRRNSPIA